MSEQVIHVARKSFMAYVLSAIRTTFWFVLWAIGAAVAFGFDHPIVGTILLGICLLVVANGVYNLIYLRTMKWVLTDEAVTVKFGILPWARTEFAHPYETIFEAFYTFGFFAKIFGYGELVIRRTEGNTTAETMSHMANPGVISAFINKKVKELRKAQKAPMSVTVAGAEAKSAVEQLAELARLRESGAITAEDYEIMKARIVGGQNGEGSTAAIVPEASGIAPS
jgi:uncharacterized membrane protein YdbT with pleckstrin-like domain